MSKLEFKMEWPARAYEALGPSKLNATLRRHMRRATALNAMAAAAEIRKGITNDNYGPNAALTEAIKGSDKPLADRGQLFKSITHVVKDDFTAFAGVLRTDEKYNIAVALHEGFEAKVTPAMRGLFFVLYRASNGSTDPNTLTGRAAELFERYQDWLPLSPNTTAIVVAGRPFVDEAFKSVGLRNTVERNWQLALTSTFRDLKQEIEGQ
jgi:hypothetical protein